MPVLYAQTSGSQQTNSADFTPIPGLSLPLPEGDGLTALVILNLPNPYATGNDYPGGTFAIAVNGTVQPAIASFTYTDEVPPTTNRMPTTLCVGVPLIIGPQTVVAMWQGVRGSTVILDSPATLSVVF
jgi:hypothetical protein